MIHRDIKPANILLRDGRVQVADFGIALAVSAAGGSRLTETGLSVGTPHYMSPEQATGDRELDGRSDLYSLGCVLYEMLAGEPPHTGPTAQSILAKILTEEPKPLGQFRRSVPPHVEAAVDAALEKLPADRIQSAGEFATAMAREITSGRRMSRSPGGPVRPGLSIPSRWGAGLLALSLVAAGGLGYLVRSAFVPTEPGPTAVRSRITFDETAQNPRLSPDGTLLAYTVTECPPGQACRDQLMVQDVAGGDPIPLGPTGPKDGHDLGPTFFNSIEWSPDGQRILFLAVYAEEKSRSGVYTIPRLGGTPTMLADGQITSAAFRSGGDVIDWIEFPDGREALPVIRSLFPNGVLEAHPLPVYATKLDWSPDGRWLALVGHREFGSVLDGPTLAILGPDWQVADQLQIDRWVGEAGLRIRWDATGDAVYTMLGGDFLRVGVDHGSGSFLGAPVAVISAMEPVGIGARGQFDVSRDGRSLVYVHTNQRIEVRVLDVTPAGLTRRTLTTGMTTRYHPALSPSGEVVAYLREDQLGTNVYLQPIAGGRERALTATEGYKTHPRWSSDGTVLAFVGFEEDGAWLFTVPPEGGQTLRRVRVSSGRFPPYAWFPGEPKILFQAETGMLSILSMSSTDISTQGLFELPRQGLVWGFLVSPDGESVAAFNFGLGAVGISPIWVNVASLVPGTGDWRTVYRDEWKTFDRTAYETEMALPEWRWQAPQAWEDGRLIISQDHRQGNRVFGGLWSLPIDGTAPTRQLDLGDHCGAPSYVARDAQGRRFVCIYREMASDIWKIENFDPEHHGP